MQLLARSSIKYFSSHKEVLTVDLMQLSLYSLMLRDRYRQKSVPGGLLYYMKAGHMQGLPAEDHDLRSELVPWWGG